MIVFQGPRRPDLSGIPNGFWIGWGPIESADGRFAPRIFKWHIGIFWYPRCKLGSIHPWHLCLPRFHFGINSPIGPA